MLGNISDHDGFLAQQRLVHYIDQVMDMAGQVYRDKFSNDQWLASSEKADFLAALGRQAELPMNYTVDELL